MRNSTLLIFTLVAALFGCQPEAPAPKPSVPAPAAPTAAVPAPAPTPEAAKPAPVTEPAPAPAKQAAEKAAPAKEKPAAATKDKAPAAAQKQDKAVAATPAPATLTPAPATLTPAPATLTPAPTQAAAEKIDTSKLTRIDVKAGGGTAAVAGSRVIVHYTGWVYDEAKADHRGSQFDSSRSRSEPFEFALGRGDVIAGWDQGVQGMKVGGQRTLIIPASMGYGAQGVRGQIPPNSPLVFDVELLGVR